MRDATMMMRQPISKAPLLVMPVVLGLLLTATAHAAAPGITTTGTFQLTAQESYLNQPDGEAVYSWGYGCASGFKPTFLATLS